MIIEAFNISAIRIKRNRLKISNGLNTPLEKPRNHIGMSTKKHVSQTLIAVDRSNSAQTFCGMPRRMVTHGAMDHHAMTGKSKSVQVINHLQLQTLPTVSLAWMSISSLTTINSGVHKEMHPHLQVVEVNRANGMMMVTWSLLWRMAREVECLLSHTRKMVILFSNFHLKTQWSFMVVGELLQLLLL